MGEPETGTDSVPVSAATRPAGGAGCVGGPEGWGVTGRVGCFSVWVETANQDPLPASSQLPHGGEHSLLAHIPEGTPRNHTPDWSVMS